MSKKTADHKKQKNTTVNPNLQLGLILLVTLTVFSGVFKNGFTDWDDNLYVTDLELIRSLSWANIKAMFSQLVASLYTPLTILSYAIDYSLFGLNPSGFHTVNLILHLVTVALVFRLVSIWTDNAWIRFGTVLLFAIHPLNTEPVAWVSGRKDLLFSLFYVAGLLTYYKYRNNTGLKWIILTFGLFLLSILSKPTALTFPFVLLLIDFHQNDWKLKRKEILEKIPFILVSIGFLMIGIYIVQEVDVLRDAPEGYSAFDKLCLAAYALAFYIYSTPVPFSLNNFHSYPHLYDGKMEMIYYLSPLFLLLLAFLLWKFRKDNRKLIFFFLFFLFVIGPTIRFIPTGYPIVADRYFYLASIGIIMLFVVLVHRIGKKIGFSPVMTTLFLVLPFALFFAYRSSDRVKDWENSISLWESALEEDPTLHNAYTHLGKAYDKFGNDEKALFYFEKALAENPNLADILNSAGVIYFERNQAKKALEYYNRAIEKDTTSELPFYNRGNLLKANRYWKRSIEDYNKALQIKPAFPEAYNNRGVSRIMMGDSLGALEDFQRAVQLNPQDGMFQQNLQRLKSEMGQ